MTVGDSFLMLETIYDSKKIIYKMKEPHSEKTTFVQPNYSYFSLLHIKKLSYVKTHCYCWLKFSSAK